MAEDALNIDRHERRHADDRCAGEQCADIDARDQWCPPLREIDHRLGRPSLADPVKREGAAEQPEKQQCL
jgi:hypothetical protein